MYTEPLRISVSARKHGVADEDMQHAVRNFVIELYDHGPAGVVLHYLVGPARNGRMLELVIMDPMDPHDATIIHAMPARASFIKRLQRG